jgi:hypothetical protein
MEQVKMAIDTPYKVMPFSGCMRKAEERRKGVCKGREEGKREQK